MLRELTRRAGVDPALVDDVVMGCVSQGLAAEMIARASGPARPWRHWPSWSPRSFEAVSD